MASFQAGEYLSWTYQADRLMADLLSSPNRHTRRLVRADVEHFRHWLQMRRLPAESLPLMLAILSSRGFEDVQALVAEYVAWQQQRGYRASTINRRLCTLRAVSRLMRQMGTTGWDLSTVQNVRSTDNVLRVSAEAEVAA